jgi:hypothetical protein
LVGDLDGATEAVSKKVILGHKILGVGKRDRTIETVGNQGR